MVDWGTPILLTVAQIRAIGGDGHYSPVAGVVGLDYIDEDYSHVLHSGGNLSFSIDAGSAHAHGLDGIDLSIEMRVPGVNQDTCDIDADVDFDGLNFEHAGEVGIYADGDALSNMSWIGSNGATSPDVDGDFTVTSANAKLSLTIPSNYSNFLDMVPDQNFPTGMPGMPEIGYYHRSNIYIDYDGELDQNGDPFSVPSEGLYCWRGFAVLTVPLTGCSEQEMTLRVFVRQHSHSENHLSDSTRQTEYVHDYTELYMRCTATAGSENVKFYLPIEQLNSDPDYEQVIIVELSGFATGDLRIDEPYVGPDPLGSKFTVKVFEGTDTWDDEQEKAAYNEGGISAIVTPTYQWALIDNSEDNAGHDTRGEFTVRMFDYRESAGEAGADLTAAWGLSSFASIITNVCNAWNCSVNQDNLDAFTLDDEDNRLTNCYAFDVCYPDCTTVGQSERVNRPLLQDPLGFLNCSIRCGTWNIVNGIVCSIRTDKVVGGAAHGLARTTSSVVRNRTDALKIWRRPYGGGDNDWVVYMSGIDVDGFGMWHSDNLQEYNPTPDGEGEYQRWEYGISQTASSSPTTNLTYAFVREYCATGMNILSLCDLYLYINRFGAAYRLYENDLSIKIRPSFGLSPVQDPVTIASLTEEILKLWCWNQGNELLVGAEVAGGNERLWVSKNETNGPFTEVV